MLTLLLAGSMVTRAETHTEVDLGDKVGANQGLKSSLSKVFHSRLVKVTIDRLKRVIWHIVRCRGWGRGIKMEGVS